MRRGAAGVSLAVAGLFWAAPALGDATITAGPVPNTYSTKEVTIDQGQAITFQNSDNTAPHDVTSDESPGHPAGDQFKSETIQVRGAAVSSTTKAGWVDQSRSLPAVGAQAPTRRTKRAARFLTSLGARAGRVLPARPGHFLPSYLNETFTFAR